MTAEKMARSLWWWVVRGVALVVLAVIAVFVWGYVRPKPAGFAPTRSGDELTVIDGWTRYTIDATSRDDWEFFDFGQGQTVDTSFAETDWDLAFKRTSLRTNSGATHPDGHGGAVNLGPTPIEQIAAPPSGPFVVDQFEEDDSEDITNPAISGWYNYNFVTHTVHPRVDIYLVRVGDGLDALVHFDSYYCDDESAGCITLRYRLVPAIGGP